MPDDIVSDKLRMKELNVKRISIKGQITKFKNYLSNIVAEPELSSIKLAELSLKLGKFEALSKRFDDLQNEIEVLNSENISAEIDERDCIERDIITNIATAKTLIDSFSNKHENSYNDNSQCHHDQDIGLRLPQIQIAKFDGAYFRWLEFRDTFENLIHNNNRMSPIHKFHYLISYLEGDAARVISNLEVSTSNYPEAWNLLCSRYNNKRILINHHLNSLFNIKPLPRESERSLRFLVDQVTKNLRALSSLGQPTDKWDVLIIFMLSSKLDAITLMKWEEHRNSLQCDVPTLDQFYTFLTDRANVLEALNRSKPELNSIKNVQSSSSSRHHYSTNNIHKQEHTSNTKSFLSTTNKLKRSNQTNMSHVCIICNENHRIYDCPVFKAKGIDDRLADVSKYKLCSNCLRQGHPLNECRMGPCRDCKKRHNTLLHKPSLASHIVVANQTETVVNYSDQISGQILLSTAVIEVSNPNTNQRERVRALLDCGSQSSFVSNSLKTKLSLKPNPINSLKVVGIGNNNTNNVVECCNLNLSSLNEQFNITISCLVLNELTGYLPKCFINIKDLNLPKDIKLADPTFYKPAPVDILIGADLFWDILKPELRSLGSNNPKLQNTKLGWLVSGPIHNYISGYVHCNHVSTTKESTDKIEHTLTKFWEIEEVPNKRILSENDKLIENHFLQNTIRDSSGRFCVKLPLKESPDCLGNTFNLAKRRFINLEKRFKKNQTLKFEYVKFINEYAQLGHLSVSKLIPNNHYFLCHHAVLKDDSESTKLRVVFDGSAPSTSGYSLNDILLVGPNVQDSLFSILLRARQYKYLLTGDVEKMYRQISVAEKDRDLQLILWRDDESKPIQTLRLNTVTYGTASASYLSTRCLWQIGEEQNDPLIKNIIQRDFYVDDLLTGSDDESELRYIQISVANALKSGCFNLRKYKSNLTNLVQNAAINSQDKLSISESSSTLGLGWDPVSDTFNFPLKEFDNINTTKRTIMSNAFKIFDPLGLLSPFVILSKMILQKLWQQRLDWEQPVPQDILKDWHQFSKDLHCLSHFKVSRSVLCNSPRYVEMHIFSDASLRAYGACIYLRSVDCNNHITTKLLCEKSKVAPLKPTTVPRLELCAALLAARLSKSALDSLRHKPSRIVYWCDSSVVLGWIKGNNVTKLKTFVANRVSEILEITDALSWRYVPTASNPADLISRGVRATTLISMHLWWSGPDFLSKGESDWPLLNSNIDIENLPEAKSNTVLITEPIINFERYSSLSKLQRSVAYVKRFINNLKNPNNKHIGILTVDELNDSFTFLCIMAQRDSFSIEYDLLSKGKPLNARSKILSLSPYIDEDKVIRVGGRLGTSNYPYEKKYPILLHSKHHLTKLYFIREHLNTLHAGPQLLLATGKVRERVWPISGRIIAKRTVNNCVTCRRMRGNTLCPKMGNLPSQRVNIDYPFLSVGLDFAGPFHIINRKGRGGRVIKCYMCLFVCLRFKCIHLEAVSDLSKDAFIMTLKRFISRRGKPFEVWCDNGRNFVAAAKEIGSFVKQNIEPVTDFASQQGINFKFIPTYTPHFGGIWEAGVKSAKHHLKRVMGNSHLTFEEISTLFTQVEAILNSRPLSPLSSSPSDFLSLTPGHFLIGRPLTSMPVPALENYKEANLRRYARLEKIRQHFWQRWQKEYVCELQQRTKWKNNTAKLNVGDLVLLQEDHLPPLNWRLGRVARLYPGSDGLSRVADVNTTKGCERRSLVRLCPLPTSEELNS